MVTSPVITELSRISYSYFPRIFFKYLQSRLSYENWPRSCHRSKDWNLVKTRSMEISYCTSPLLPMAQLCSPPTYKKILMSPHHHDLIPCKGSFGAVKKYLLKYLWNKYFTGVMVHWAQKSIFYKKPAGERKVFHKRPEDFQRYFFSTKKINSANFFQA